MIRVALDQAGTVTHWSLPNRASVADLLSAAGVKPRPPQVVSHQGQVVAPDRLASTPVQDQTSVAVDELPVGG